MSGVKGRSGRKSRTDEAKRQSIIDKAWDIAKQYLEDPTIDLADKIEVACKIIVKDMPDKLTDGQGDPLPLPIINVITTRSSQDECVHPGEGSTDIGDARL